MKQLLLFTIMISSFIVCNAQKSMQKVVANPLIYEFYPETKVEIILNENPEEIVFWNAIYDFGYEIKAARKSQKDLLNSYDLIEIADFNKVNILGMNLFPKKNETQHFRIKDSDKILTIFSEELIRQKLTKEK